MILKDTVDTFRVKEENITMVEPAGAAAFEEMLGPIIYND